MSSKMTTETKPMKVESDGREIKKLSLLQALMVPLGLLLMGCGPVYFFYGFNFFLPLEWKLLNKTSEDWNRILEDKSMLMLGGHHRGGTTLMWNMLKLHQSRELAHVTNSSDECGTNVVCKYMIYPRNTLA